MIIFGRVYGSIRAFRLRELLCALFFFLCHKLTCVGGGRRSAEVGSEHIPCSQRTVGKPEILCFRSPLDYSMAYHADRVLKVPTAQYLDQKACGGRVSHGGFPGCVGCRQPSAPAQNWCCDYNLSSKLPLPCRREFCKDGLC